MLLIITLGVRAVIFFIIIIIIIVRILMSKNELKCSCQLAQILLTEELLVSYLLWSLMFTGINLFASNCKYKVYNLCRSDFIQNFVHCYKGCSPDIDTECSYEVLQVSEKQHTLGIEFHKLLRQASAKFTRERINLERIQVG